jgi:hypothetical protein
LKTEEVFQEARRNCHTLAVNHTKKDSEYICILYKELPTFCIHLPTQNVLKVFLLQVAFNYEFLHRLASGNER